MKRLLIFAATFVVFFMTAAMAQEVSKPCLTMEMGLAFDKSMGLPPPVKAIIMTAENMILLVYPNGSGRLVLLDENECVLATKMLGPESVDLIVPPESGV